MKQKLVERFLDGGFLVGPELLSHLSGVGEREVGEFMDLASKSAEKPLVLTKKFFISVLGSKKEVKLEISVKSKPGLDLKVEREDSGIKLKPPLEKPRVEVSMKESESESESEMFGKVNHIKVLYSYNGQPKKYLVEDFVEHFKGRYNFLRDVLVQKGLENLTSLGKVGGENVDVSVIASVLERRTTKKGNILIRVEDPTGTARVIVMPRDREVFENAGDLVPDEVVGLKCRGNSQFLFASDIVFPDVFKRDRKKGGRGYAAFTADLHVGSDKFLEKNLLKFVRWLNCDAGSDKQKALAREVKYVFILGDLVAGVGVYPGQENELEIKDIYEQYEECAHLLSQIRDDVKLVIMPGNHDAGQIAEPQPILDAEIAGPLYKLKNVLMLGNPAFINVGANGNGRGFESRDGSLKSSEGFEGYNILFYHGYALNYLANNMKSLIGKAYREPGLLLKQVLKKRHFAPTHGATRYLPLKDDPLLIREVPDVLVTADLHKTAIDYYNNVLLIGCSCWQDRTSFEEKVGHVPDPCKVPLLDMASGQARVLDFS